MRNNFIVVFITCASGKEAVRISGALLKKRLAACVNTMHGIDSRFWWEGKIVKAKETFVIAKTTRAAFAALEHEVKKVHSYEVPEIIALPIIAGNKSYLSWIDKSVK